MPPVPAAEDSYPDDPLYEELLRGWSIGWQARQHEIDRLNEIADYWYLRANNTPAQVAEIVRRRLDRHFEEQDRKFFKERTT
jgi:hypothetical protein